MARDMTDFDRHTFGEGDLEMSPFLSDEFGYAGFTPANGHGDSATVSPNDIWTQSAPNSNTLTDITSPSGYNDTPDSFGDCLELSGHEDWAGSVPLFPKEPMSAGGVEERNAPWDVTGAGSTAMTRTSSSQSAVSAVQHAHRLSLANGITKSAHRRTSKVLAPIEVEGGDTKAAKRAKNTMAARKSRQKKRDENDGLRMKAAMEKYRADYFKMRLIQLGEPIQCEPDMDNFWREWEQNGGAEEN